MRVARKRIWAFHDGPFVGMFIGKEEVGSYVAEYLRAPSYDDMLLIIQKVDSRRNLSVEKLAAAILNELKTEERAT